jgi:hypothetical protein
MAGGRFGRLIRLRNHLRTIAAGGWRGFGFLHPIFKPEAKVRALSLSALSG